MHGSHDRDKVRPGDIAIEIDAGQAFGTGHHGTTAGCLEVIDTVLRSRPVRNALDLGTGSGVLAIAVRKLKNIPVLATDIDPIATRVAAENVRRNGIASGIVTRTAPGFHSTAFSEHGPFDLIIANILARPLIKMAPKLAAHLAPGGSVILSGILAAAALEGAFRLQRREASPCPDDLAQRLGDDPPRPSVANRAKKKAVPMAPPSTGLSGHARELEGGGVLERALQF